MDRDVETIVFKALAKEPARRYQSAGELAGDLRHYLAGEPLEARRDSTWYVLRKLARRHLAATLVTVGVFVIAVSAAVVCFAYYQDARRALAGQLASDRHVVKQGQDFDTTGQAARATLSRMSLGWFLLEWNADRLDQARSLCAKTPAHLSEHAAMQFLLDPSMTPEQLLARVPPESAVLAYFVAGEREYKAGRLEAARRWWQQCVAAGGTGWLTDAARARLAQLPAGSAGED